METYINQGRRPFGRHAEVTHLSQSQSWDFRGSDLIERESSLPRAKSTMVGDLCHLREVAPKSRHGKFFLKTIGGRMNFVVKMGVAGHTIMRQGQ